MNEILQMIRPLSSDERMLCESHAKDTIRQSLDEPTRHKADGVSDYPPELIKWVWIGMAVIFVASALPSFFRLFTAGRNYFMMGIDDNLQGTIVGFATFLLAEFMIIVSAIASRVIITSPQMKRLFYVPMVIGFLIALEGNRIIENPHDLFGWLMTIAPPIAVLTIATIAEYIILEQTKSQFDANRDYDVRLSEYRGWYEHPETHKRYMGIYADSIRTALIAKNSGGQGAKERKELMAGLNTSAWSLLVKRERALHEGWYQDGVAFDGVTGGDEPMPITISTHRAKLPYMTSGGGNIQSDIQIQSIQNAPKLNELNELNIESRKKRSPKSEKAYQMIKENPAYLSMKVEDVANAIGVSVGTAHAVMKEIRSEIEL